ncbi:MAG: universal stress protein [Acidimicrobiales bacterium]
MTTLMNPNHPPIVVGVDGSPGSESALRWAVALGRATGHPVRAVMVLTQPVVPGDGLDGFMVAPLDPFDAAVELERSVQRTVRDEQARVTVDRRVVVGNVVDRLLAEAHGAAVLVVGQSSSTFGHRFFGVARRVVASASCPVVVVPWAAEVLARAGAAGAIERHPSAAKHLAGSVRGQGSDPSMSEGF